MLPMVAALQVPADEETRVTQGELTYIFPPDSGAQEFELIDNGIIIDGSRLVTLLQGGSLEITLTRWSAGDHQMELISTVPQTITFKWFINGSKQYIKDDDGLYLDTYQIGTESAQISLLPVDDSTPIETRTTIYRAPWGERTVFFVVIDDQVLYFRNSLLVGILIFISIASFLYYILRRK